MVFHRLLIIFNHLIVFYGSVFVQNDTTLKIKICLTLQKKMKKMFRFTMKI